MTEAGGLLVPGIPSIKETFSLFCGGEFLEKTVFFTNRFANSYIEQNPGGWYACRWKDTDDTEMEAFFGTLLFIGVFRGRNENYEDLWSDEYGRPQLKAAMSLSRFKMLMKFLRFDERRTRPERKKEDKLAAIRILWDLFVSSCRKFGMLSLPVVSCQCLCQISFQLLKFTISEDDAISAMCVEDLELSATCVISSCAQSTLRSGAFVKIVRPRE